MSANPDLSIVVLGWNTRELLLSCLESIEKALPELAPRRGEVIVVDNGSVDGSGEAVRRRFVGFDVVALERNTGFARGMNAGLRKARGHTCLLLNSDTRVEGRAIARCLDVLESDDRVAAVGPQLVHPDGRLQNSVHAPPSLLSELAPTVLLEWCFPKHFPSKRRPSKGPVDVPALLGAALFVRRDALLRVGPLAEDYFFFLEDTDWCVRARRAGLRLVHVPDARVEHLSGGSSKRRDAALTRIEFHRSLYRFLRRHRGPATLALAVMLRTVKGLFVVAALAPLAPLSPGVRVRLRDRARLLAWHLRGRPASPGVAQIEPELV